MKTIISGALIILALFILSGCGLKHVNSEQTYKRTLSQYPSVQFIKGMHGAENILTIPHSSKVYVTDLSGMIYLLDKDPKEKFKIVNSLKIGNFANGIVQGLDGYLYVNASKYNIDGWLEKGGEVYRVDQDLQSYTKLTKTFPGINGLAIDTANNLYFSIGDMELFSPDGAIYKIPYNAVKKQHDSAKLFINKLGSANGLVYSKNDNTLLYTETFSSVSKVSIGTRKITEILDTTKLIDGFDDLCIDSKGRLWLAQPINGFMKMYNPKEKALIRFDIEELGMASSCAIRMDEGKEYIYITEREVDNTNDGRGVIILPLNELLQH